MAANGYQPILREIDKLCEYYGLRLVESGLLIRLYLKADPYTGIYATHARRLAEEMNCHVETLNKAQRKLKRCRLVVYSSEHSNRKRPYFMPLFILQRKNGLYMTRPFHEMLERASAEGLVSGNGASAAELTRYMNDLSFYWLRKHFNVFARKVEFKKSKLLFLPEGKETKAAAELDLVDYAVGDNALKEIKAILNKN